MKVLLVHNFYQQFGGEDAVFHAERKLLAAHNDEVYSYTRENNEIKQYTFGQKARFGFQSIFSRQTRREITDVVNKFVPDFAYVHNVFPLISPSLYHTLHALRVPVVQVIHNFRFLCPNGWFYTRGAICERCKGGNYLNAIRYRCYRDSYLLSALYSTSLGMNRLAGVMEKIGAFVCLSEFSRSKLREVGVPDTKLFVRPNFIDATTLEPKPGAGTYVLYLGRLSQEKGIGTLLRAFERLPDVALKIVGTGPLESELKAYVHERNLKNVCFHGFAQGAEKDALLRNSLCLVLPSEWYENFPVVALEAYAAAKPVIASNVGSLPYVVEEGRNGFLFEPRNPEDLATKIRALMTCRTIREDMGNYNRSLVESKYSPEQGYQTLHNIVHHLKRPL
jgi:glycosyltransferase involved in cell wall biosynthesis